MVVGISLGRLAFPSIEYDLGAGDVQRDSFPWSGRTTGHRQ
jgi:hypothetical protein